MKPDRGGPRQHLQLLPLTPVILKQEAASPPFRCQNCVLDAISTSSLTFTELLLIALGVHRAPSLCTWHSRNVEVKTIPELSLTWVESSL